MKNVFRRLFRRDPEPKAIPASYMICATPRCGSGMLGHCLWSTGRAGNPTEYFAYWTFVERQPERLTDPDVIPWLIDLHPYMAKLRLEATTPNGVLSIKVMADQLEVAVQYLRRLDPAYAEILPHEVFDRVFPSMRYVQITRRDKVRQAVSWAKASLTNEWFRVSPEASRQDPPPAYDFSLIDYYYHEVLSQERMWKAFFAEANVEPYQVVYEDFPADWEAIARALLDYVGVPKHPLIFHTSPERRPQRDGIDAQWARRYREECLERGITIDTPLVGEPPLLAVHRKR